MKGGNLKTNSKDYKHTSPLCNVFEKPDDDEKQGTLGMMKHYEGDEGEQGIRRWDSI